MSDRFDLDTAFLHIADATPSPAAPPGLAVLAPPRRAARGREKNLLLLSLHLRARVPPPPERYTELLNLAASTFFSSSGSTTSALRQALNAVNQNMLNTNLREGGNTPPLQGGLICAVLQSGVLYAVQSGPGLLVVAHSASVEKFPLTNNRALGVSNALDVQYFNTTVVEGDYLVLSSVVPPGWRDTVLSGLGGLTTLSFATERLRETAAGDVLAVVGRVEPAGGGSAPRPASVAPSASATKPPSAPSGTDWSALKRRAERLGQNPPPEEATPVEPEPMATKAPIEDNPPDPSPSSATVDPNLQSPIANSPSPSRAIGRALGVTLTEAALGFRRTLARMLPEGVLQKDGLFTIPTPVFISIAVAIPVLVGVIVAVLYLERGRAEQFTELVAKAQVAVQTARQAATPGDARPHWRDALQWLQQADTLQTGDAQVIALHQEAQGRLDELDWVTRLDYQPLVLGGIDPKAVLKQVVLVGQDVYALDTAQNRVWRIMLNTSGQYIVDRAFTCASGTYGEFTIGNLIDLALLPGPNIMGTEAVIALDTAGGLLYCAPDVKPLATYLPAPDTGWIRPSALEVYADRLYVLDPGGNEVWQFVMSGGGFQAPTHYFTQVAYNLGTVIEFSIAQGELFLLHKDGHVSKCARTATGEPATCTEAVQYLDPRPGQNPGERLADVTLPTRLAYDPPPEPSLYLLDQGTAAIYQFSLKLMLVQQFRPRFPIPDPITSLTIDPAKRIFITAGDKVYVGARP